MPKNFSHPIITSGLLTIGFTAIVHISNYLYTLLSVRYLSPLEYSDLALIVSFFSLMGVFAATLSNTALSLLSRRKGSEDYTETKKQILHSSTVFFYLIFIFSLLVLTPIIHFVFDVESIPEIIIILTAGLFSVGNALLSIHFQLHKKFFINGSFGVTSALLKLVLSFVFLYLGYKIFGVALALFFSTLFAFIAFYPHKVIGTYKEILSFKKEYLETTTKFVKDNKKFLFKTFISSLLLTLCLIIDTLSAKKLLSPELAAQYIGMSTLAKLFFYSVVALGAVIFPYLLSHEETISKKKLFNYFMLFISASGILALIVSKLFAVQLITLVLGGAYTAEAQYFIYILLVSISATFAYVMINLSSLLDAAHFSKNVALILTLSGLLLVMVWPQYIQTLALSITSIFTFTAILLYNVCVKKHL
jgi:O-antigen/teichoic acid export membrane protein